MTNQNYAIPGKQLIFSVMLMEQKKILFDHINDIRIESTRPGPLDVTNFNGSVKRYKFKRYKFEIFTQRGYWFKIVVSSFERKFLIGFKIIAFLVKPVFCHFFIHFCVKLKNH